MEALTGVLGQLLASQLLPQLDLLSLQALAHTCAAWRQLVLHTAPEEAWRRAAANSTSKQHPVLASTGGVLQYLRQRAGRQAAAARPETWQRSPRILGDGLHCLSPDLSMCCHVTTSWVSVQRTSGGALIRSWEGEPGTVMEQLPMWSPDGACVCYMAQRGGLWLCDLRSGARHAWQPGAGAWARHVR